VIIYFDVTELILTLRRTGIQRVERELIRHWPGPASLHPCWFDPIIGRLCVLPHEVLSLLAADVPHGGLEAEARALTSLVARSRRLELSGLRLLNAELFFSPARAALYEHLTMQGGNRVHWLVYDFLPWLHPQFFTRGAAMSGMAFLRALRHIRDLAFISKQVRADYHKRIMRGAGRDGPVLPLGGDGLGIERQTFTPTRTDFIWIGTIEPRKNPKAVLCAFMQLWGEGTPARLIMIGRREPAADEEGKLLHRLRQENQFSHICGASDAAIRERLQNVRALVFPSKHEGFGLPPLEALYAGIPVIVWKGLPALGGLSSEGQIQLESTSANDIASAVRWLMDDTNARRLWAAAATLAVPTWRDFALACAAWVQAT
jgi:glycosyltransferase involved in cell wall biosynthesis